MYTTVFGLSVLPALREKCFVLIWELICKSAFDCPTYVMFWWDFVVFCVLDREKKERAKLFSYLCLII